VDISKLLEKAKECADKRNYDMAVQLYREALKLSPDSAPACRDLRAVEIRLAKEKPASFMTKTKNAGSLTKAHGLMVAKKWDAAIEAAEDVLITEPGSVSALVILANAALEAGYIQRAMVTLEDIKTMNAGGNTKSLVACLRKLGHVYEKQSKIAEASDIWYQVNKMAPGDREATQKIRDLSARTMTDKIQGAAVAGVRGSAARSTQTADQAKAADRLEREGSAIKTEADLKLAIDDKMSDLQQRPDDPKVHSALGDLHKLGNNYNESKKYYDSARQKDPNNPTYLFKLHDLEIWKMMNGLKVLEPKVRAKDPAASAQYKKDRLALLEYRLKSYVEREKQYSTDSKIKYDLGMIYQDLAVEKQEKGFFDEAIRRFQTTFQDPKFRIDSGLRMGMCFASKVPPQFELALKRFDDTLKGIELKNDFWKTLMYWKADTLEKAGKKDDAKLIFLEVYEIDVAFKDISKRVDNLSS
jgi:tetratricopeptide (TPR) repeat protein